MLAKYYLGILNFFGFRPWILNRLDKLSYSKSGFFSRQYKKYAFVGCSEHHRNFPLFFVKKLP